MRVAALVAAAALAGWAHAASAATPPQKELTGTLKRIKDAGVVRMGYRDSAVPFSMVGRDGKPVGYSIDLCLAIAEEIAASNGGPRPRLEFHVVMPDTRVEQIVSGRIDLECGATSNTEERRARVAFSPVIYVAGTRLLVTRGSSIYSLRDMENKRLVTVAATTNARAMLAVGPGKVRNMRLVQASGYHEALAMMDAGTVDAMAADDILIEALLDERGLRDRYIMVGNPLTHESYGIMFARDDPGIAAMVQAAFRRLAMTGELRRIYDRWFVGPLPSGRSLGIPMNRLLEEEFRGLGMAPAVGFSGRGPRFWGPKTL